MRPGRRDLLLGLLSLPAISGVVAAATPGSPYQAGGQLSIHRLFTFGDSYTATWNGSRPDVWPMQLKRSGAVRELADHAQGGATAANTPRSNDGILASFDQQVQGLRTAGIAAADGDVHAVYFGQNDVSLFASLSRSKADIANGIDALIARGATAGTRRLLLVRMHDVRHNPGIKGHYNVNVPEWLGFLPGLANARRNVVMVDLLTAFDEVFKAPSRFGFANVATPDFRRAATTALYRDVNHFGAKGERMIGEVIRYYLTTGWATAVAQPAGSAAARSRLVQDIAAGRVFTG
jgi:hypothetical protein